MLSSDAHQVDELSRIDNARMNVERAWIDPDRVANAWSAEKLAAWARRD